MPGDETLYFAVGCGYGEDGVDWGLLWATDDELVAQGATAACVVTERSRFVLELFYSKRTGDLAPGVLECFDHSTLYGYEIDALRQEIREFLRVYLGEHPALIRWHHFNEWAKIATSPPAGHDAVS